MTPASRSYGRFNSASAEIVSDRLIPVAAVDARVPGEEPSSEAIVEPVSIALEMARNGSCDPIAMAVSS